MGSSESKEIEENCEIIDDFVECAEKGDEVKFVEILQSGPPINAPGKAGYAAIIASIKFKRENITNLLLELDSIDINVKCELGKNSLMYACENDMNYLVDVLLQRKAKKDEEDIEHKWTALHYAAFHNNIISTRLLLENHVAMNSQDYSDQTPLHIACYKGHVDVVKLLLEAHVDVQILDNEGNDALQLCDSSDVSDLIIKYLNDNGIRTDTGRTADSTTAV